MKSPRGAGKDAGAPTRATGAAKTAERGIYSAPPYAATAPGGLKSALPGHFRSRTLRASQTICGTSLPRGHAPGQERLHRTPGERGGDLLPTMAIVPGEPHAYTTSIG